MQSKNKLILYFLIAAEFLLFLILQFIGTNKIVNYTVINITASIIFLFICYFISKTELPNKDIFLFAGLFIFLRLFFINTLPIGSDDIYRYMWDGKVQSHGINPYLYAPNDAALSKLHSELLPAKMNFIDMKTIYFPLSQWLFYIGYSISGESVWGYKLILFFSEILTFVSIYLLIAHLKIKSKYYLFYVLSPLPIIHFAIDAHLDALGFPLILFSLLLYLKEKKILSAILLGLSLSIKPIGLVLIPIFFLKEKGIINKIKIVLVPVIVFSIQFIPYIINTNPFEAFLIYTRNWIFNGFIFDLLNLYFMNNQTTRMICGIMMGISLINLYSSKKYFIDKIYFAVLLMMIFSPVVHPWYIGWLAILIPLARKWSGIYFTAMSSLTSFTVMNYQLNGIWKEYWLVLILEYIPVFIFLVLELRGKLNYDTENLAIENQIEKK